jgi:hypothetical protein
MAVVTFPMRADLPSYGFQLELEGRSYGFVFRWNERESAWYFDVLDGDGELLRSGLKIVLDFPLFLRARSSAMPPGQLFAVDTGATGLDPGLNELGARVQLVYYESSELPLGA